MINPDRRQKVIHNLELALTRLHLQIKYCPSVAEVCETIDQTLARIRDGADIDSQLELIGLNREKFGE